MKMDPIRQLLEEAELRKFIDGYTDDPQHSHVTIVVLRANQDGDVADTPPAIATPRH